MVLWAFMAVAGPSVTDEHVRSGSARSRILREPADVVLLYAGEQRGLLGACGCEGRERGGLGRIHDLAERMRQAGQPVLLLNPGNWLDDRQRGDGVLRRDIAVRNEHMSRALEVAGFDFLNVSKRDSPQLRVGPLPSIASSANLSIDDGFSRFSIFHVGELKVAVLGVAGGGKSFMQPSTLDEADPVKAVAGLLPELRRESDLIVVLAHEVDSVRSLAELDIDVLIEADGLKNRLPAVVSNDTVWVRTTRDAPWLGELRLHRSDDGWQATNRAIDLDKRVPVHRDWKRRALLTEQAVFDAIHEP